MVNLLQNLWGELKRRVHMRGPGTLNDLERFCKEQWSQMVCSVFCKLIKCCRKKPSTDKGTLFNILNTGVPIIVEQMIFFFFNYYFLVW